MYIAAHVKHKTHSTDQAFQDDNGCGHNLDIAPATYVINKSPRAKLVSHGNLTCCRFEEDFGDDRSRQKGDGTEDAGYASIDSRIAYLPEPWRRLRV
ncbi:hypothetical protein Tco_0492892 [Tanacetum coccineum]